MDSVLKEKWFALSLVVSTAEDCIVIVLHNHPSLSDFSLSDVQFLLRYRSVKMMVVVTNLGSISYLVKGKGERISKELMKTMTPFILNQQKG